MSSQREHDIKAPDGYTLGGIRLVRSDGTVLFQRGWWQAPKEWAGEKVWVHENYHAGEYFLEVAEPGFHIYEAKALRKTIVCERTERPDAKPAYRTPDARKWVQRMSSGPEQEG